MQSQIDRPSGDAATDFINTTLTSLRIEKLQKMETMIEPEKIIYGYRMAHTRMIEQPMYVIPLKASIDLYWNNLHLRNQTFSEVDNALWTNNEL